LFRADVPKVKKFSLMRSPPSLEWTWAGPAYRAG
jgi:hypothetical protein